MRIGLLIILGFITVSSAFGQKSDSLLQKNQKDYDTLVFWGDKYFNMQEYGYSYKSYTAALKIKPNEKYPKEQAELCKKNASLLQKQEEDSLSKKEKQFSFIGKWLGKVEGDGVILIFNADGSFRGKQEKDESYDMVGIWKTMGDTLYIEGDEINKNDDPHDKSKAEKIYFTYKVQNNNEVLLYLIEEKEELTFKRIQQ